MQKETIILSTILNKSKNRENLLKKKLLLYYKTTNKREVKILIKKLLKKSDQNIKLIDDLTTRLIRIWGDYIGWYQYCTWYITKQTTTSNLLQ